MSRMLIWALVLAAASCDRGPGAHGAGEASPIGDRDPGAPAPALDPVPPTDPAQLAPLELQTGHIGSREVRPLIVALHGRGGRPESFARVFDGFDAPARIVVPAASYPLGPGYSWVPAEVPGEAEVPFLIEGADRVAELIVRLQRAGAGPAIVVGFSQGGCLAYILAARHPDLLSFAVPIASDLPREAWPSTALGERRGPRVRALHGAADPLARVIDARRSVVKLRMLGYDATVRVYGGIGHSLSGHLRDDLLALLRQQLPGAGRGEPALTPCQPCAADSMDPSACAFCR